ncbi:MAG TPA: FAD-dependent oxidoreductase [Acidimicrobiia bacterium]|nr:FAD-dependent oxidoreductase [Acidimicrobiia bacterium]
MPDDRTFLIVGASLTGAKAAETLRAEGFEGRVLLVGDERSRPYERPPLSKTYLRGESDLEKVFVHPDGFYAEHGIELRSDTTVTEIDRERHEAVLGDDERIAYDRLLVATGAEPRRIDGPGAALENIHYLRNLDDADLLRAGLAPATSVAVVGGGWIGAEVAASARQLGHSVTMIHSDPAPLVQVLGPEVAEVYRALHAEHGVELRMSTRVESFRGGTAVEEVVTEKGDAIVADLVVVGIGVRPRTQLAIAAGLDVDNGIVVDQYLRTSDECVYAAGDVASAWHPFFGRRVRVEHWSNALNQGRVAALNMLDLTTPYDRLPYFFSDQYDAGMEYLGHAPEWDRVVFRGDPRAREFIAFWVKDDRVVAAMNMNVWDVVEPLRAIIHSRRPIADAQLRDTDVPLEEIATGLTAAASAPGSGA